MNVLITSASRKAGLISAFQDALAREGGGKVVAVDASPLSAALYLADDQYLVPSSDEREFLELLLRMCRALRIDLIIPTRDEELPFFAANKQRFADRGVVTMVPDPSTVTVCQDKRAFIEFCQVNGFAVPRIYEQPPLAMDLKFPVFVRGRYGKGGRKAARVNSRRALDAALEEVPDAIIQEFVSAPEYTVDLFADFTGRVISAVPRERVYVVGGEAFVSKTTKNQVLIREGVRLAEKLRLVGHNTIQCFLDAEAVKFIEVNPRFGGGASLGFAAGAHTPLLLVKLLKGETLEPRIGEFRDNHVMLRYTRDVFVDCEALSQRVFR